MVLLSSLAFLTIFPFVSLSAARLVVTPASMVEFLVSIVRGGVSTSAREELCLFSKAACACTTSKHIASIERERQLRPRGMLTMKRHPECRPQSI